MKVYCKLEDKTATVFWEWKEEKIEKNYMSSITPIKVDIEEINSNSLDTDGVWSMITFDNITEKSEFSYKAKRRDSPVFNNRVITSAFDGRIIYQDGSNDAGAIRARDIKFTPDATGYKIKIFDLQGNKLFEEYRTYKNPPIYKVACGKQCPPDHVKCEVNHYPGYCCIPCEKTANKINNLASRIK